jgi:hypothetical protein
VWLLVVLLTGSGGSATSVSALGRAGLLVTGLAGGFVSASATGLVGRLAFCPSVRPRSRALLASLSTFAQLLIVIAVVDRVSVCSHPCSPAQSCSLVVRRRVPRHRGSRGSPMRRRPRRMARRGWPQEVGGEVIEPVAPVPPVRTDPLGRRLIGPRQDEPRVTGAGSESPPHGES